MLLYLVDQHTHPWLCIYKYSYLLNQDIFYKMDVCSTFKFVYAKPDAF